MFTATADEVLPTTTTGSWPRPRWFDCQLGGRPLSVAMQDVTFREQFSDAVGAVLSDQERAGLDIVSNGDYHHDDSLGGYHWVYYPLERLNGFTGSRAATWPDESHPPGTLLHEVETAWRWPRVVDRVERDRDRPLEFAKIWRLAQSRTSKPVKFGTASAQVVGQGVTELGGPYGDDQRALIWDTAKAINEELRELAAAGCKVIQIEDTFVHPTAHFHPDASDELQFYVDAFNREVEGLDDVEIWVHTCWGNSHMQAAFPGASYANSIELYLERMNFDVWTVEAKSDGGGVIDLLGSYRDLLVANDKKVALGVVSQRTLSVETPEEVADFTRRAMGSVPPDRLILTNDCGFSRPGGGRLIALYKSAAMALGANIVRRELGLEQRYVPIAEGGLQADVSAA